MPSNDQSEVIAALRAAGISEETIAQIHSYTGGQFAGEAFAPEPAVEDVAGPGFFATKPTLTDDPYAPTAWGGSIEEDFVCPSGQVCLVRKLDVIDLVAEGVLNSVDFLTETVQSKHINAATVTPGQLAEVAAKATDNLAEDPEKFALFSEAVNKVVLRVVAKPELQPVPAPGLPRVNGVVYIDAVRSADKFAIFNFVVSGKRESRAVAQFRSEGNESVGAVESREDVPVATVELPRDHGPASA